MDTIALTKKLIRFKSTDENKGEIQAILQYITRYIKSNIKSVSIARYRSNGYTSLLFSPKPVMKKFEYLFVGHVDVVEGSESLFHPKTVGSRLYGRGAADMKSQLAVMIHTFIHVLQRDEEMKIGLLITSDEELGGFDGVEYVLRKSKIQTRCAFVPDGEVNWSITLEQKGVWHVEFYTKGKAAHASEPWNGCNAIDLLINFYTNLRDEFYKTYGNAQSNEDWIPTLSAGKIHAGKSVNSIPAAASLTIDFRFTKEEGKENMKKLFEKMMKAHRGIKMKSLIEASCLKTSKDDRYIIQFEKILEKNHVKYTFCNDPGASDARYFPSRTSVIMLSPKCGGVHQQREWIDIYDLQIYEEVVREFIMRYSLQHTD